MIKIRGGGALCNPPERNKLKNPKNQIRNPIFQKMSPDLVLRISNFGFLEYLQFMPAVKLHAVTKTFGKHTAVNDLSLDVPEGTVYGFIGPNGSGKTTTLRMIMRILHPDRGEISVLGQHSLDAASDRVGYLPEERGLYKQMKVRDLLRFYADLKGFRNSRASIDAWLERLGLADWADKRIEALSKGMAQKIQFIATVVAKPKLVLLDEPFSGLDLASRRRILEDFRQWHSERQIPIVYVTHSHKEAVSLGERMLLMEAGRIVAAGAPDSVLAQGEDFPE